MKKIFMIMVFMIPFFLTKGFSQDSDRMYFLYGEESLVLQEQYGPFESEIIVPFNDIISYKLSIGGIFSKYGIIASRINQFDVSTFYSTEVSYNVGKSVIPTTISQSIGTYWIQSEYLKCYSSIGLGLGIHPRRPLPIPIYSVMTGVSTKLKNGIISDFSVALTNPLLESDDNVGVNLGIYVGIIVNSEFFK